MDAPQATMGRCALACLYVNAAFKPLDLPLFALRTTPNALVEDLRTFIVEKNGVFLKSHSISEHLLKLYKLRIPLPSNANSYDAVAALQINHRTDSRLEPLIGDYEVADYFDSSPANKHIHLLVQLPLEDSSEPTPVAAHVTRREGLVTLLYEKVKQHRFIQVRGSPACGKSTLLHLLHHHIRADQPGTPVYRIEGWQTANPSTYESRLSAIVKNYPHATSPTYILFDDAQDTYTDPGLWNGFFKGLQIIPFYYVILFCNYGSAGSRILTGEHGTPDVIEEYKRLLLWPTPDTPSGLLLTRAEFDDMLLRTPAESRHHDRQGSASLPYIHLALDLRDTIFWWTGGHVGAVDFLLDSIRTKNRMAQRNGEDCTLENFLAQHPLQDLASSFSNSSVGRGFPPAHELRSDPEMSQMFRTLLRDGYILERDDYRNALNLSHKRGWTYSIKTDLDPPIAYILPSPMHASFLSWTLLPSEMPTFHTLQDLMITVVSHLKPSQLFLPIRRAGQTVPNAKAPEAQYQDEFYRAIHDVTHGNVRISPEFASEKKAKVTGRTDFFIPNMRWGIEITQGGDKLKQHTDRFATEGAYEKWLRTGEMTDYILLDCRTTKPKLSHQTIQNLYHAVFEEDISSVSIYDKNLVLLHKSTLLQNHP